MQTSEFIVASTHKTMHTHIAMKFGCLVLLHVVVFTMSCTCMCCLLISHSSSRGRDVQNTTRSSHAFDTKQRIHSQVFSYPSLIRRKHSKNVRCNSQLKIVNHRPAVQPSVTLGLT